MRRVGYIGLGLMGKSIARNLMRAGHSLAVYNRSSAAVEELVAEGAVALGGPAEVARWSEVVFTNLPDSPDVEQVVLGANGVREGAHAGMIYVDNSTIKPEVSRRIAVELAEVGVLALDAPVSGGDIGAREATLAIMVGGPQQAFDDVLPLFQAMGRTITRVGSSGAGQVAKACNQIMAAAQMVAMSELLVLAQKSGVDPQRVVEAIRGGAAQCWTLDVKAPRLFAGNRQPGFKAHMMHKDLAIILETARAYGASLPMSGLNLQLYEAMLQMGMRDLDNSAILGVYEALAGTRVPSPVAGQQTDG
ncbi:MAG: NAD(P)-binding domain-containing protein [Anaerolineales bacterium]|nr:NAD(P)-binding domain-containing protein [Anaerolineales bacterium]